MKVVIIFIFLSISLGINAQLDEKIYGKVKSIRITDYRAKNIDSKDIKIKEKLAYHIINYNNNGQKVEENSNYYNKRSNTKTIYIYNNQNNLSEQITYEGNILSKKINYQYNDKNQIIVETIVITDEVEIQKVIYKYDNNGNKIEGLYYIDEKLDDKFLYTYHNNYKTIKEYSSYKNGEYKHESIYEYNEKGNLTKDIYIDYNINMDIKVEYKYIKYDKKDNWTERILFLNGFIDTFSKREIEYYN